LRKFQARNEEQIEVPGKEPFLNEEG